MLTIRNAVGTPKAEIDGRKEFVPAPTEDKTDLMLVGPAERGPVFVPTEMNTVTDLEETFGLGQTYTTYAARKALEETDRVKFIRILHERGWVEENPIALYVEFDEFTAFPFFFEALAGFTERSVLLSLITVSEELKNEIDVSNTNLRPADPNEADPTLEEMILEFRTSPGSGNRVIRSFRVSFNPFSVRYIENVLEEDDDVNLYLNFGETHRKLYSFNSGFTVQVDSEFESIPLDFEDEPFRYAQTPWIVSQTMADGNRYPLFRFVALGAGRSENRRFKIGIREIGDTRRDSDYDFFTVQIRELEDNDFRPEVLEEYRDVTLDPNHERYIARVIGDRYFAVGDKTVSARGGYENQSQYVRVEMHPNVRRAGVNALPYGFQRYFPPIAGEILQSDEIETDGGEVTVSQSPTYRYEQSVGNISEYVEVTRPELGETLEDRIHLGFDFDVADNLNWLNPVPKPFAQCFFRDPNITEGADEYEDLCTFDPEDEFLGSGFHLEDAELKADDLDISDINSRKFVLGLQGGFDGADPFREKSLGNEITSENFYGYDLSTSRSEGTRLYKKAFGLLEEVTGGFNFNLLSTPGVDIKNHFFVVDEAERLVRERGDAFYITDITGPDDLYTEAINQSSQLDSNFVAAYYGWGDVTDLDPYHDTVPSAAVVSSVYIRSDLQADPWFAPAGFRRGSAEDVRDVTYHLTEDQMDDLYEVNVNTLNYFNPEEIVVWGQKTLSQQQIKLDRVNIRRLLVTVKTEIRKIAERTLFEQNIQSTINQFRSEINNYLSSVRVNQGIFRYEIDLSVPPENESQSTIEDIHTIRGNINLYPVDVAEYIILNFVVEEKELSFV